MARSESASEDEDARPEPITVYRLEGCPYCERVVKKLNELDLDYHSVWVESRKSRRNRVKRVSGQRGTPVIVDDNLGVTMAESGRILEFLEKAYGDGADGDS